MQRLYKYLPGGQDPGGRYKRHTDFPIGLTLTSYVWETIQKSKLHPLSNCESETVFIHSFDKYLLKACYVSSCVLGVGDAPVNKTDKPPCFCGAYTL